MAKYVCNGVYVVCNVFADKINLFNKLGIEKYTNSLSECFTESNGKTIQLFKSHVTGKVKRNLGWIDDGIEELYAYLKTCVKRINELEDELASKEI